MKNTKYKPNKTQIYCRSQGITFISTILTYILGEFNRAEAAAQRKLRITDKKTRLS